MTYNLAEIIGICIENNVDFEAVHGDNGKSFRTALLVNVGDVIRADFDAPARGRLLSRVHLASNHKVVVKIDDLVTAIKSYNNPNRWANAKPSAHGYTMPYTLRDDSHHDIADSVEVNGSGHLVFTGEIVAVTELNDITTFTLRYEDYYRNTVTNEIVVSEPKFYHFDMEKNDGPRLRRGSRVSVSAQYIPNKPMVVKTIEQV
jgi:hypothetical protein